MKENEIAFNFYKNKVQEILDKFNNHKIKIIVPKLLGLYNKYPDYHFHSTPELIIQLHGEGIIHFPTECIKIQPNTICIIPRGLPHLEKRSHKYSNIVMMLHLYKENKIALHTAKSEVLINYISLNTIYKLKIIQCLDEITEIYHRDIGDIKNDFIKGLLLTFLSYMQLFFKESGSSAFCDIH